MSALSANELFMIFLVSSISLLVNLLLPLATLVGVYLVYRKVERLEQRLARWEQPASGQDPSAQ